MKSLKVRTDKIQIPDLQSVNVASFKPSDKKLLIDLFCNDDMVQQLCNQVLGDMQRQNQELINDDMLTYLNTNSQG
jgi:hypothetical protein